MSRRPPIEAVSDFAQDGATFPFGAHVAVVEVDLDTGRVMPVRTRVARRYRVTFDNSRQTFEADGHVLADSGCPVRVAGILQSELVLFEAMTLTFLGGMLGVVLAIGISKLVMLFVPSLPASIPMWAVTSGISVSTAVGLIFGVWPARKAARLDPIECLRYE